MIKKSSKIHYIWNYCWLFLTIILLNYEYYYYSKKYNKVMEKINENEELKFLSQEFKDKGYFYSTINNI